MDYLNIITEHLTCAHFHTLRQTVSDVTLPTAYVNAILSSFDFFFFTVQIG